MEEQKEQALIRRCEFCAASDQSLDFVVTYDPQGRSWRKIILKPEEPHQKEGGAGGRGGFRGPLTGKNLSYKTS